jgi:5-keto 4-deoxyuronate isomerase
VVGFIWSFWESLVLPKFYKSDVVKTRQASHGLTEIRQKVHWKIMLSQGGEREKYTHLR